MADVITAEQAAKRLGITIRTLWRWRDAGKLTEAGRAGKTVMFYAQDVDELARAERGIQATATVDMCEAYRRLTEAESWEDVAALRRDIAATICATAEDKGPLEDAYRAACLMAATHHDEGTAGAWRRDAMRYGAWLGEAEAETDKRITNARNSPRVTFDVALSTLKAAPADPAYAIARNHGNDGGRTIS